MSRARKVQMTRVDYRSAFLLGGAMIALMVAGGTSSGFAAAIRESASYKVQFDTLNAGGGAVSSASYSQPQTVIGAEVMWANYTSPSHGFQPTGVIQFPSLNARVGAWQAY